MFFSTQGEIMPLGFETGWHSQNLPPSPYPCPYTACITEIVRWTSSIELSVSVFGSWHDQIWMLEERNKEWEGRATHKCSEPSGCAGLEEGQEAELRDSETASHWTDVYPEWSEITQLRTKIWIVITESSCDHSQEKQCFKSLEKI